jgi:predicted O-linked N-acetylglucosamine transferase (SPINDLY family)
MVSSRLIEGEEAQGFHTETLALLDALPTELLRPDLVADTCSRAELGMDGFPGDRFYVCPTKLQKLHPDFDAALVRLVKADPQARIVLFEDSKHLHWRPLTEARQLRTMGEAASRVMFVPWADARTFQSWLKNADVVLDCWPFGLGTTAILAVGLGVPIVTLPGSRMISRTTLALMSLMDMHDLVAVDVDDYVKKAVSMSTDKVLRQQVSSQIAARSDRVFGRRDAARVTAEFFVSCLTSTEHT